MTGPSFALGGTVLEVLVVVGVGEGKNGFFCGGLPELELELWVELED